MEAPARPDARLGLHLRTLRGFIEELRDPRHSGPSLFAGAFGLLLGIALGAVLLGAQEVRPLTQTAQRTDGRSSDVIDLDDLSPTQRPSADKDDEDEGGSSNAELDDALEEARRRAEAFGGKAQVGIWVDDIDSAFTVGGDAPMRMWSMSKPVVALALLEASNGKLSPGIQTAMRDAITKSDNCAVRLLTLELQRRVGGPDGARAAFAAELERAGAKASPVEQERPADPVCHEYLRAQGGAAYVSTPAVLFGTAEWTIKDALVFAGALSQGAYESPGDRILDLMRQPKQRDPHARPEEFTASLQFGAGIALGRWEPAYKAGWGGSQSDAEFLVGQIVTLRAGSRRVAIAAMYHPPSEPDLDDPGKLHAPQALETMFRTLERRVLVRLGDPP